MEVKTKYNIGDEVWTMLNNRPHCFRIAGIEVFQNSLRTFVRNVEHTNTGTRNNPQHLYFLDSNCFPTKEELIKNLFNG